MALASPRITASPHRSTGAYFALVSEFRAVSEAASIKNCQNVQDNDVLLGHLFDAMRCGIPVLYRRLAMLNPQLRTLPSTTCVGSTSCVPVHHEQRLHLVLVFVYTAYFTLLHYNRLPFDSTELSSPSPYTIATHQHQSDRPFYSHTHPADLPHRPIDETRESDRIRT